VTPLFQNRDFVRLWAAVLLSNYGSMVRGVALPWLAVLVLDAEPRHMALLGAAALLPGFALGLLAAPLVDRWRRRPVLVASDFGLGPRRTRDRGFARGTAPGAGGDLNFRLVFAYAVAFHEEAPMTFASRRNRVAAIWTGRPAKKKRRA